MSEIERLQEGIARARKQKRFDDILHTAIIVLAVIAILIALVIGPLK